ncbi:MAG TPA: AI-2E family transporter [Flavisolibacter sp.]|nr:AI-2E family transporter [Flavisolibacter sp.]
MTSPLLNKSIKVLLFFLLLFTLLYFAKPFLVPILIAVFLSMLLLPLCRFLESKMPRGLAVVLSLLVFLVVVAVIGYIVSTQITNIAGQSDKIEKNIQVKLQQVEDFVSRELGITRQKQQQMIQEQEKSMGNSSSLLSGAVASLGSFATRFIILVVYMFLFLYYREHFSEFILKVVPSKDKTNTKNILHDVQKVAQHYLTGLAMMIGCLWVMYGIGFSVIGVKNALFYAMLCGLLEIVPFVGNLTGVTITVVMTLAQGGDLALVVAVIVTYGIVQLLQTYILEPLVVGKSISIHPVFTIVGLVGAEILWGIPGMALVLPLLGVTKILCDHIEPLKPYGFLIGEERTGKPGLMEKVKKKIGL